MRSPRRLLATAVVVLLAGLGLAGCSSHPSVALSKLAHLDEGSPLPTDAAVPSIPGADADLLRSSLRLMLTESTGTEYWVGVTRDDDVCFLVAAGEHDPEASAASCVSAGRFGQFGAFVHRGDRLVWLHTEYMTVNSSWTDLSQNIAVRS